MTDDDPNERSNTARQSMTVMDDKEVLTKHMLGMAEAIFGVDHRFSRLIG